MLNNPARLLWKPHKTIEILVANPKNVDIKKSIWTTYSFSEVVIKSVCGEAMH